MMELRLHSGWRQRARGQMRRKELGEYSLFAIKKFVNEGLWH